MQHGQHGAEVLATVMRQIFEPLVRCVYEQGGFISTQAGDAFTALFPGEEAQALCSLAAAWEMQKYMAENSRQATIYGDFDFVARIGLAWGEINLLLFWGAPTSYENDIDRAIQFVLAMQTRTSIPLNAGITYQISHTVSKPI